MESYPEFAADVYDESNRPVQYEIGANTEIGNVEIGEDEPTDNLDEHELSIASRVELGAMALRKVVQTARDNRAPAPPMRAVDVDAPEQEMPETWALVDTCIGAAADAPGTDPFPRLTFLLNRCGAATAPRLVRVDTEESYAAFRAADAPELAQFRDRLSAVERKLTEHARDPYAHERIADEIEDLVLLGEEADKALAEKRIDMGLEPEFDGKHDAWCDGEWVFASLKLPAHDGSVRWCTAAEPAHKAVTEMSRHAADAAVPPSAVVGMLPAMGVTLGAGTVTKEMAAAAPSILARPEAQSPFPFMVRIEPKSSPAVCALASLALECKQGNTQACAEWNRLAATAPGPVKQAMGEALALAKAAK